MRGKVKTRLARDIGDTAALNIYHFLLGHTRIITKDIKVCKEVHYADFVPKKDMWEDHIFSKKPQHGKDLGERMEHAFAEGFKQGYKRIILIGSDLYDLTADDLKLAFKSLKNNEYVIGPSDDGGYYLLGMNSFTPELFHNKTWSTPTVLKETLADLASHRPFLLEVRNDIDTYKDIKEHVIFQQFLDSKK